MESSQLVLTLFGSFQVHHNSQPLTFSTDKIRALFAYLALESGMPHRRETLASLFWPDYSNKVALRNLRQSLYRMRQTLQTADPSLPEQLITQNRQTVTFNPAAVTLDAAQIKALVEESKVATHRIPLLNEIVAIYRGQLLADIDIPDAYAFDEWLSIQRELFHQEAVDALIRLTSLYEASDDPDSVIKAADRLLALNPWHERTYRQIMRAYLNKGNRPEALARYEELRAALQQEMEVEPAPATTSLYEQIRTDNFPEQAQPAAAVSNQLHHLPRPLTPLIGRDNELDQLVRHLGDPACRLLTLTGPGGIGKTRLCIEAARHLADNSDRFNDGIFYLSLGQIERGSLLVSSLVQALKISIRTNIDMRQNLLNYLRNKQILLVLDNFEHLLGQSEGESSPAAISLLVETLTEFSGVSYFVTSRQPLALDGEWLFPIGGLTYTTTNGLGADNPLEQPAPQLFLESGRRYRPSLDAADESAAILEICRLTDGMPLALEIAAAWLRVLDSREIAERISQNLDFLTSPHRDIPDRQRSIRAIFASTWEYLSAEQQYGLAAMSVFRSPFTAQAAIKVAQASVLDLAVLVEKSLLRRTGENQYTLHELVRQFAAEKLNEMDGETAVKARHAAFYFSFLDDKLPEFYGPDPEESLHLLRQVIDDLRAAWQWAVTEREIDLLNLGMDGWVQFLLMTGNNQEREEAFDKAVEALRPVTTNDPTTLTVKSRLATHLAGIQFIFRKSQTALENATWAVSLGRQSGDKYSLAYARSIEGWILQATGKYEAAKDALLEAVNLFGQVDKPEHTAMALIRLGSIYWRIGEFELMLAYYQQSLQIELSLQNKQGIARATGSIGHAYKSLEKYEEALDWLNKAVVLARELGNHSGLMAQLANIGSLYISLGEYQQALACYEEALKIEREIDFKSTKAICLESIGTIYRLTGKLDLSLDYYNEAIKMYQETDDRFNLCESILGKGEVLLLMGDYRQAKALIDQGQQLSVDMKRKDELFFSRLLAARLQGETGEKDAAREQLKGMLSNLMEEQKSKQLAQIYYELWRIDGEREYAHQAKAAYQAVLARVPNKDYKRRVDELRETLRFTANR